MDYYIIISLFTVFGLLAWWLFLAISGHRDESSLQGAESVTKEMPSELANALIPEFRSCHYDNSTEQPQRIEPGR